MHKSFKPNLNYNFRHKLNSKLLKHVAFVGSHYKKMPIIFKMCLQILAVPQTEKMLCTSLPHCQAMLLI